MSIATESSRFYLANGVPFLEVANKSKGGFRPARVDDAIKAGAVPSVSTVIKTAAKPSLTNWLVTQGIMAALTLPRIDGETLEAFAERAMQDSQEQSKKARDKGTEIHAAIELSLKGKEYDRQFQPHLDSLRTALKGVGIDLGNGDSERGFTTATYGGKVDWHSNVQGVILDFKGTDSKKIGGKLAYQEHAWQMAAYRHGLCMDVPATRCINVFIGREDGAVQLHKWTSDEMDQAWREFEALLTFYRITNGFQ